MEVRDVDLVVVGDADGAHARADERDGSGTAEPADADEEGTRAREDEAVLHATTPGKYSSRLK